MVHNKKLNHERLRVIGILGVVAIIVVIGVIWLAAKPELLAGGAAALFRTQIYWQTLKESTAVVPVAVDPFLCIATCKEADLNTIDYYWTLGTTPVPVYSTGEGCTETGYGKSDRGSTAQGKLMCWRAAELDAKKKCQDKRYTNCKVINKTWNPNNNPPDCTVTVNCPAKSIGIVPSTATVD